MGEQAERPSVDAQVSRLTWDSMPSAPAEEGDLAPASPRSLTLRQLLSRGLTVFEKPVQLASGAWSREFIDVKAALARGSDLAVACRAVLELFPEVEFDVVGGLTMGADQFAHGIAILADASWFVVRKEPKSRGTNRLTEGATLGPSTRVLLVDDVITSGGSILKAFAALERLGAPVVAASTIVDRGDSARAFFASHSVPYRPLFTYADLGIPPVEKAG